jgi:MoxR-like ATPase
MTINPVRDAVETVIEISRHSGVPVLLLGNPGIAKSTVTANWAKRNGYALETLIGSRFTQEEILGFQVRVEDNGAERGASQDTVRLEIIPPFWYRNIIEHEKRGVPALLFLDELSTAEENVQGALLQLIFDRTIGGGKMLPASTLVIAAANYKENLPYRFNIIAPVLNRFCLFNLSYSTNEALLREFLQDEAALQNDTLSFSDDPVTEPQRAKIRDGLKLLLASLFNETGINPNNRNYRKIYEQPFIHNFVTARTVSYLYRVTVSFFAKGLTVAANGPVMLEMVCGLIGAGSASFDQDGERVYREKLKNGYTRFYETLSAEFSRDAAPGSPKENRPPTAPHSPGTAPDFSLADGTFPRSLSDKINVWKRYYESRFTSPEDDEALKNLFAYLEQQAELFG